MENAKTLLDNIKEEDGYNVIDIDDDIPQYELLSLIFHKETIAIDKDSVVAFNKSENKRYFGDSTLCYRCGGSGHTSRDCPQEQERNCFYCDLFHKGEPCAFTLCDNCLNLGHSERFCRERKRPMFLCTSCPTQIHLKSACPMYWRRYVLKKGDVKDLKVMCCPYCYKKDHMMDDCPKKELQSSMFTRNFKGLLKKCSYVYDKSNVRSSKWK